MPFSLLTIGFKTSFVSTMPFIIKSASPLLISPTASFPHSSFESACTILYLPGVPPSAAIRDFIFSSSPIKTGLMIPIFPLLEQILLHELQPLRQQQQYSSLVLTLLYLTSDQRIYIPSFPPFSFHLYYIDTHIGS